jgi:hypothetical protein
VDTSWTVEGREAENEDPILFGEGGYAARERFYHPKRTTQAKTKTKRWDIRPVYGAGPREAAPHSDDFAGCTVFLDFA